MNKHGSGLVKHITLLMKELPGVEGLIINQPGIREPYTHTCTVHAIPQPSLNISSVCNILLIYSVEHYEVSVLPSCPLSFLRQKECEENDMVRFLP